MANNSKILNISIQEKLQLDNSVTSKDISKSFGRKEDINTILLYIDLLKVLYLKLKAQLTLEILF